ncbi:MAG: caspase family protein [Xanthobacteraceae bacterium]
MRQMLWLAWLVVAVAAMAAAPLHAQPGGKRIAFVVGDGAYQAAALATPANDAGLLAQTLQATGFDVVGARDLDQASLVNAWNDFLAKAQAAGPEGVAFVYLAGYGLQFDGENYFASVDAQIASSDDIATQAIRLSDLASSLASVPLKARIIVLDAARANPFALDDPSIAGGLALVDPADGSLIAFNAAPGTIAPESPGPYGPYAQALAEMLGQVGLPLDEAFTRTRMRVGEKTNGAFVPWNASKIAVPLMFREGPPETSDSQARAMMAKPVAELGSPDAFVVAERQDTVEGYQAFLAAYPDDALAPRVRAMLAVRREAMVWHRTYLADAPNAYWSYLSRYPHGPHAGDARRRLTDLAASLEPPPSYEAFAYDLRPPPPEESIYVEQPVMMFGEPAFAFAAPPPPAFYFLPPVDPLLVVLPPPAPAPGPMILPVPAVVPVMVNHQPFRPVRPIGIPTAMPNRPGVQHASFSPLVNPAARPGSPRQTAPLLAPGPRPLVNPAIQQGALNPQKPGTPNKLQLGPQQQLHANPQPAATASIPPNRRQEPGQGRPSTSKPPTNQQPQVNRQPAGNAAIEAGKPHDARPAHVNPSTTGPANATAPHNPRVNPPNAVRPQTVNRQPAPAPHPVPAHPAPPKPAPPPRQAAACGHPGQPACKH